MRSVRLHHDAPATARTAGSDGGRLNLLLSYAGWEDDPWVDRLPKLLDPMGISAVRAQTGSEASRVIRERPVHIAVVDLGLPLDLATSTAPEPADGLAPGEGGAKLLELLARLAAPPPTVVIKRGRTSRDDQREIAAALRLGAFAVLDRPRDAGDLEMVLRVLRRVLERHYRGRWPQDT